MVDIDGIQRLVDSVEVPWFIFARTRSCRFVSPAHEIKKKILGADITVCLDGQGNLSQTVGLGCLQVRLRAPCLISAVSFFHD